jgi:hypothetical protein
MVSWGLCADAVCAQHQYGIRHVTHALQFQTFHFSSRTDSGVHALANSAHVTITRRHRKTGAPVKEPYECSAIQAAMNHRLRQQEFYCRVTNVCSDIPTTLPCNISKVSGMFADTVSPSACICFRLLNLASLTGSCACF